MKALQGAPRFAAGGPGVGPQQVSPVFPRQYPAPYAPVTAQQDTGFDISSIMNLMMMMMVMGMMMGMMKGMFAQVD